MNKILVIGAGRSATSLIDYLLKNAVVYNWHITVADVNIELAQQKVGKHSNCSAVSINIDYNEERRKLISENDLIISMLPAFMHGNVARDCVALGKHMATASYVSEEMQALNTEAIKKGIFLLNEAGLDPGIDHASAMKIIDEIHSNNCKITSFKSYCGGLGAPESNTNPCD